MQTISGWCVGMASSFFHRDRAGWNIADPGHLDEHLSRVRPLYRWSERPRFGLLEPPHRRSGTHLISPAKLPSASSTPMVVRSSPDRLGVFLNISPFRNCNQREGIDALCVYPIGVTSSAFAVLGSSVGVKTLSMPSTSRLCAMPDQGADDAIFTSPTVTCSRRTNLWVSHRG